MAPQERDARWGFESRGPRLIVSHVVPVFEAFEKLKRQWMGDWLFQWVDLDAGVSCIGGAGRVINQDVIPRLFFRWLGLIRVVPPVFCQAFGIYRHDNTAILISLVTYQISRKESLWRAGVICETIW